MNIALVAMGGSLNQYVEAVKLAGSRKALFDETWVVNALGDVIAHDLVFHMDDVAIQEQRAQNGNKHIAEMLSWLQTHDRPILTSVVREGYPNLVAYPLQEVLEATNTLDWPYFNNTAAYPIAYAIYLKTTGQKDIQKLSLYGMDYTYVNRGHAEAGRACAEWWCRAAKDAGIGIRPASQSTLLDVNQPLSRRLYGYDACSITIDPTTNNLIIKEGNLPSAASIEARYAEAHRP